MVFSSFSFLFGFLPITFLGVLFLSWQGRKNFIPIFLVLASFVFYGYWNYVHLWVIGLTIVVNYSISLLLFDRRLQDNRALILAVGITFNLLLLAWFKYAGFILYNFGFDGGGSTFLTSFTSTALPIGVSFYTFQQIAYLVDVRRGVLHEPPSPVNYALFVSFFPQLIAGPIVHHREIMPQLAKMTSRLQGRRYAHRYLVPGIIFLIMGLSKKVLLADSFAYYVDLGFGKQSSLPLSFIEAWGAVLSYTFQIYFDFSGYTDMAIGLALLFCVQLPKNFNSPYQSGSIIEFWRRWHMTLSHFLRDYLYFSLGGNRRGEVRRYLNIMITMILGGFWHGASWAFVLWGAIHGAALAVSHLWHHHFPKLHPPRFIGVILTFIVVVFAWVPFRSEGTDTMIMMWRGMLGFEGIFIPERYASLVDALGPVGSFFGVTAGRIQSFGGLNEIVFLAIGAVIVFGMRNTTVLFNSQERAKIIRSPITVPLLSLLLVSSLLKLFFTDKEVFLYYQF